MTSTQQTTSQANALAVVVASMAKTRKSVRFTTKDNGTYVYGWTPGALERIAFVSDTGNVEWIA